MTAYNHLKFKQLDIYWVNLEPTVGHETQKQRPCVIIQNDLVNQNSKTLIIAPLLKKHKSWPFAVNISPSAINNLDQDRHINLKQLRSVDISRLINKNGSLEIHYLLEIKNSLNVIF